MTTIPRPVVLHVENNDQTAYCFRAALRNHHADVDVFRLCDGDDALMFLNRTAPFADAPHPDVVVLDFQLPRKNGYDVLAELRRRADFDRTPVIVFSSAILKREREPTPELGLDRHGDRCVDKSYCAVAKEVLKYIGVAASSK